ncbi:MAG: helicase-related protein [Myxococcales bacterium]
MARALRDPRTRILFASDAGGVGLNLQRAASCCVNLELPWNPAVLDQRIGRIHRLGQASPVEVYCLVSAGGIEQRISFLVGDKRALFSGLFDGQSDEVAFERSGSFLSRIEKLVEPPPSGKAAPPERAAAELAEAPEDLGEGAERFDGPPPDTLPRAEEAPRAPALAAAPEPQPPAGAEEIRSLFAKLEVRPGPSGRVIFEAPPEVAASLAAVFEGMARLLSPR